jgi:hypothetical protein
LAEVDAFDPVVEATLLAGEDDGGRRFCRDDLGRPPASETGPQLREAEPSDTDLTDA